MSNLDSLPDILALNKNYEPAAWLTYEACAIKYAKGDIIASLGQHEVVLHGGINARTGLQSVLVMDSIVVTNNNTSPYMFRKAVPTLSNDALFKRDRNMCAYCGQVYKIRDLTCDHIIPVSKGGQDNFLNCVTSCKACNNYKDDMSLEQAEMQLLYTPYIPHPLEMFLLSNRKILKDQMDFLLERLPKHSRLHQQLN